MDIRKQLEEYCDCAKKVDQKDVDELISLISMATCWTSDPTDEYKCDTFMQAERREIIDLPLCMDCAFTFKPFYRPYVKESFEFSLVTIDGTSETSVPIDDYYYSEVTNEFRINTGLPSCKCACKPCGCPPEYKLVVKYVAGYEAIPDCLIPVFCNLLDVIHAKNLCDCERGCGCGDNGEAEVQYASGDVLTVAIETDIAELLRKEYMEMIGRISLCEEPSGFWGVLV